MKNRKIYILFIVLLLAVATTFCGYVVAKYIREKQSDIVVTSKDFFFTVDLLGDTINDEDLSKSYVLAGGDSKEIIFYIQNLSVCILFKRFSLSIVYIWHVWPWHI